MMTREEMMKKIEGFTDGELDCLVRSIETQREISEEMKKTKEERVEEAKCKLSDIDITMIGAVKADSLTNLMSEMNKMQKALEGAKSETPEGSIVIREFLINSGKYLHTCNFTVDFKIDKDQIQEMNNKIGKVFF